MIVKWICGDRPYVRVIDDFSKIFPSLTLSYWSEPSIFGSPLKLFVCCTSGSFHVLFSVFHQSGVRLVRGIVKDVKAEKLILDDGTEVPYGLLVWSTGVGPSPLIKSLDLPKAPGGR